LSMRPPYRFDRCQIVDLNQNFEILQRRANRSKKLICHQHFIIVA
jgi:hypothetical protein